MWSTAFEAILTTLRYLAPATLLTLFWGQQSFLFKLLKHIDSVFRAIVFSSDEQKKAVLQWLAEVGPVRVEHLDTVWRHGWILCGVLDGALPGACAGHPPTRLSLKHAQAIADHYLGVEPVFSRQELESNDSLSRHQEWKLATYLDRIRLALAKLTPAVSRPPSQRTSPVNKLEASHVTFDYVARGSGLTAAQVNNKVYFKIYPTAQQALDPGEITVLIRGPKDTYGMTIIPPILGKAQLIRQNLLGLQSKPSFTENALPITQGATYLRNYGKNDMNKTYFIPKTKYDVEIEVETRKDHARVGYTVNSLGKYEISITSRGLDIVGSPFKVTASTNILGVLEKESFCLEDGEEIDIVDVQTDRKVVLRIVDFVTEKMLLRENGCLEKISDEEAKFLMETDVDVTKFRSKLSLDQPELKGKNNFIEAANKVIKMNRVCNLLQEFKNKKASTSEQNTCTLAKSQQYIPDIVNSTFSDTHMQTFLKTEKQGRVIIPESISVSIMTEKSKHQEDSQSLNSETNTEVIFNSPDYLEKYKILRDPFDDDELSVDTAQSSNNPFINEMYAENYTVEKKLGTFLPTEYETNNSQNEEIQNSALTICIEHEITKPHASTNNPFVDVAALERPKSPVFKIVSGETTKQVDTLYIEPKRQDTIEEILGNEFINPFFTHHHLSDECKETLPVTDFIIGAPVSLPPILRATSPELHLDSIVISGDSGILDTQKDNTPKSKDTTDIDKMSSIEKKLQCEINSSGHSSFHTSASSNDSYQNKSISNIPLPSASPKNDVWDSAYVSIDETNSTPDTNNNDNSLPESISKQPFPPSDELSAMGPAEREIWESCSELKENISPFKIHDETRPNKWDHKRSTFTPIIEENDRSLYTDMKDSISETDTDPVTNAFSELNEIFNDYFPQSENGSTRTESNRSQNLEIEHTIENNDIYVDSASEQQSDVKRHVQGLEGKISEVQASVTESDSASRILHVEDKEKELISDSKSETQFGDHTHSNIVLEKKKYWDEKIRQIQAKTDEIKAQQKKRKISTKPLKHNDSLSKKKGKQMIKNFLNASDDYQKFSKPVNTKQTDIFHQETTSSQSEIEKHGPDVKLVEKWKNFWDNKLESEKETEINNVMPKSSQKKEAPSSVENLSPDFAENDILSIDSKQNFESPNKQELPEEVFRAFETSPKRFFGTSRRQILSKIDTFLGKPQDENNSSNKSSERNRETGLVSSRISLFHSISRTEELPWARRKCTSLHDLHQQKEQYKNTDPEESIKTDNITKSAHNINEASTIETGLSTINGDSSCKDVTLLKENKSETLPSTQDSFEENQIEHSVEKNKNCVKMAIKELDQSSQPDYAFQNKLNTSISKSEMDIFNKVSNRSSEEDLDKHKSYEDLPKINVKSFISLYESASKSSLESKSPYFSKKRNMDSQIRTNVASSDSGTHKRIKIMKSESLPHQISTSTSGSDSNTSTISQKTALSRNISPESTGDSIDIEIISNQDQDCTYLSLSDIDLEIVENSPKPSHESTPERKIDIENGEYKNRFQMAKQYFQSLEELREEKKSKKLNECEMLLYGAEDESLTNNNTKRQPGKRKPKSNSLPSSEIAKAWNELQDNKDTESNKMVKISEKFNVEDLFNDVMDGRLSRQGSLRGIPHKKAVLEAFKSMENITDKKPSSYEMAVSQLNDFAKENQIKNAQTYLSEYPYLPTTDPSKYHSRCDANASGLISLKEVLDKKKDLPRRNSVPDLRLNPTFTVDL